MSYRPSSLLPLTIIQLTQRALSHIIESPSSLTRRALPASLIGLVPECTAHCLESFIAANYPASSCSSNPDLTCLCTHTTPSGLTIGEAALSCLVSSCPSKEAVDESKVYSICSGIPDAIAETIRTLIITMTSADLLPVTASTAAATLITSTLPSSILFLSNSPTNIHSIVSDTGTPVIPPTASSPAPTTLALFGSTASSAFVTPPAAQNTSSLPTAVPQHQAKLTRGQIVGIAIAGGAVVCFALGVLVFISCLRKRRGQRRRNARFSLAIEKQQPPPPPPPPRLSTPDHDSGPAQTTFPDPADLAIGHGQRYYATPSVEERRRSFWRRSIKPEDIGVAVSPDTAHDSSPDSFLSQRTASQLLPALPNYGLWPAPLRLSRQMPTGKGSVRPESTATVFEEDVGLPLSTYRVVTGPDQPPNIEPRQEMTERVGSSQVGSHLPNEPRAQTYPLEGATAIATQPPIPLTPVYDNGVDTPVNNKAAFAGVITGPSQAFISTLPQPSSLPFAQDPRRTSPGQGDVMHQRSLQTYSSAPNLTRNQPQQQQRQQQYPRTSASTPSFSATTTYTAKRPNTVRQGSVDSAGSDVTGFETDDDTTPEHELDKRLKPSMLSPVVESPVRHRAATDEPASPIRDLRYPRIPRPAAVAKQAERAPKPRAALQVNTTGPQPQRPQVAMTRDQLVLEERSFLQSQSTSRASPEPNPSLLAKRRGDRAAGELLQGGLKLSSDWANRPAPISKNWRVLHSEEQPLQSPRKPKLVVDTRETSVGSGSGWKRNSVGLTPTRRGGDLFLTVG
jgi:hypothetical protein